MSNTKLNVNEIEIVLYKHNEEEYISLTDMAKYRDSERTNYIIQNWMRTRNTIEFLGLWENLNNPKFKRIEFDAFRIEAGSNSFTLTPKKGWNPKAILHTLCAFANDIQDIGGGYICYRNRRTKWNSC